MDGYHSTAAQRRITVIVPQLPPGQNHLGDYGLNLARQLRQDFGLQSQFIVTDPTWVYGTRIESFEVHAVARRSPAALARCLMDVEARRVLVHYTICEQAQQTCPRWLVDGVAQWRQACGTAGQLVTMFHGLYATGAVWTAGFWVSPQQRQLVSRLAQLSDRLLTNRQSHAVKLWMLSRGKHTTVPALPMISTLGEPAEVLPLSDRPRCLVVMGNGRDRYQFYRRSQEVLNDLCTALDIDAIHDLGSPIPGAIRRIGRTPVHALGLHPPDLTSTLLASAAAGFWVGHPDMLATSPTFAAYCAHGLVPICSLSAEPSAADRLVPNRHYWHVPHHLPTMSWDAGEAIARRARRWYQTHSLSVHARTVAPCLMGTYASDDCFASATRWRSC